MTTKRCSRCRETKPVSDFFRQGDGYQAYCRPCKYEIQREWRKSKAGLAYNAVRRASGEHRRDHLKRRYKIDEAEYQRLFTVAGGMCEICKTPATGILYVDHCHETNAIRGLLCQHCNTLLGFARDDLTVLGRAIRYLKEKSLNHWRTQDE